MFEPRHAQRFVALIGMATFVVACSSSGDGVDSAATTTASAGTTTPTTVQATTTTETAEQDVVLADGRLVIPGQNVGEVDLTALPVGDDATVDAPTVGGLYLCPTFPTDGGGASEQGPWFNGDGTYDLTAKVFVAGEVDWPDAGFASEVSGDERTLVGNNLPVDHQTGTFPIAADDPAAQYDANPASIVANDYDLTVPALPEAAAEPSCVAGESGFLLSGVVLNSPVDAEGRDAVAWESQDQCEGHPNPAGYHYHSVSPCIPDEGSGHSELVGYALDGFGIFGHRGEGGEVLTNEDLDECHGHTHDIDWDGETVEMYHYHATWEYPYAVGCFHGTSAFQGPVLAP